jgi:DNA-binding response OmpR family regulator
MKIAVVEDQQILAKQIGFVLQKEGFEVTIFNDAESFLENFDKSIDILLLDINLPKMNGDELFELLNSSHSKIKTIFMTSYSDMNHLSKAFQNGCEDYIKKPFELEELILRVKRVANSISSVHNNDAVIKFKNYSFDLENHMVNYSDELIKLTNKEMNLIKIFLENLNKVVTFETLNEEIWDSKVNTNTITVAVLRLKKKLNLENIENIREVGYIFHE